MGIVRDRFNNLVSVSYNFATINNVDDPARLDIEKGECVSLVNVDLQDDGSCRRRVGYTKVIDGITHSGWNSPTREIAYYVKNSILYSFDGSQEVVIKAVDNYPMAFIEVNDVVVFSNGVEYGIIENGIAYEPVVSTQPFKVKPQAGETLCFYNGRVYIGSGNIIYCTDPFSVDQCDERQLVVADLDSRITNIIRVDDGLFVTTDKEIIFLRGNDPVEGGFTFIPKALYGAVKGTAQKIDTEQLKGFESNGCGSLVASIRGICFCGNGGVFKNLTQDYYTYPYGEAGSSLVRNKDSQIHYICNTGITVDAFNQNIPQQLDIDSI